MHFKGPLKTINPLRRKLMKLSDRRGCEAVKRLKDTKRRHA